MQEFTLKETAQWLQNCEDAHILIHRSPDGDCIGSGYALAEALRQMGKRAAVLCSDPIPERYQFLLPKEAQQIFSPKCVISVDVADAKLLGENLQPVYGECVDLSIDHHISHRQFAGALCLDGSAAAACQIVYQLVQLLPVTLTDSMVVCLYTGIATDTGCFQFDNVSPATHRIAADLMERCPDVNYAWINRQMFAVKSMGRLHLEQLMIDHLEPYFGGKCVLICITQEFIRKFGIDDAELEGIAGFPLQVQGAEVGIVMKEKEPEKFRISMRSAGETDVSAICAVHGGGGHRKAAGCLVCGPAAQVRAVLLKSVSEVLNTP